MLLVFTLLYPSTSPSASLALISLLLTKAPDNNTPAIKITWSVLLEAMFVAHFVAAAFWHGCGQIFIAAASCAIKVDVCHEGNGSYPVIDAVYFCANLWHCHGLFRYGGSVA